MTAGTTGGHRPPLNRQLSNVMLASPLCILKVVLPSAQLILLDERTRAEVLRSLLHSRPID